MKKSKKLLKKEKKSGEQHIEPLFPDVIFVSQFDGFTDCDADVNDGEVVATYTLKEVRLCNKTAVSTFVAVPNEAINDSGE